MRHPEEHKPADAVKQVARLQPFELGFDQSLWLLELICQFIYGETHLLHHYPSKTMGYKYNRSFLLLITLPYSTQFLKKLFSYDGKICTTAAKDNVRVIAESHDSGCLELRWEKVPKPIRSIFGSPCIEPVSPKSMDRNNTRDIRYLLDRCLMRCLTQECIVPVVAPG